MRYFTMLLGTGLIAALLGSSVHSAEPQTENGRVQANTAVHESSDGTPVTTVGRNYPRRYYRGYRGYYGPRYYNYGNPYYYGPRYRSNYYDPYYGRGYYRGYGSYYRGPAGAVDVYPGGVNVGGLHIGW